MWVELRLPLGLRSVHATLRVLLMLRMSAVMVMVRHRIVHCRVLIQPATAPKGLPSARFCR